MNFEVGQKVKINVSWDREFHKRYDAGTLLRRNTFNSSLWFVMFREHNTGEECEIMCSEESLTKIDEVVNGGR